MAARRAPRRPGPTARRCARSWSSSRGRRWRLPGVVEGDRAAVGPADPPATAGEGRLARRGPPPGRPEDEMRASRSRPVGSPACHRRPGRAEAAQHARGHAPDRQPLDGVRRVAQVPAADHALHPLQVAVGEECRHGRLEDRRDLGGLRDHGRPPLRDRDHGRHSEVRDRDPLDGELAEDADPACAGSSPTSSAASRRAVATQVGVLRLRAAAGKARPRPSGGRRDHPLGQHEPGLAGLVGKHEHQHGARPGSIVGRRRRAGRPVSRNTGIRARRAGRPAGRRAAARAARTTSRSARVAHS